MGDFFDFSDDSGVLYKNKKQDSCHLLRERFFQRRWRKKKKKKSEFSNDGGVQTQYTHIYIYTIYHLVRSKFSNEGDVQIHNTYCITSQGASFPTTEAYASMPTKVSDPRVCVKGTFSLNPAGK